MKYHVRLKYSMSVCWLHCVSGGKCLKKEKEEKIDTFYLSKTDKMDA